MSEGISIRNYRPDDLPQLKQITIDSFGGVAMEQKLEEKYGRWNEWSWQERKGDQIKDDCTANPGGVFVAERVGVIVGYITTSIDKVNSRGRIPNMAVVGSARGLGLGRRLVHHALDYFRQTGMKVAQIETMESNDIGQHLYPSCGFEEIARQVHYAMKL